MPDYSEYTSVLALLQKEDKTDVYADLMRKEKKTLDAINNVASHYNDKEIQKMELPNMSYIDTMFQFVNTWSNIGNEIMSINKTEGIDTKKILDIFTKEDRLIYVGMLCILMAIFIFFIV